VKKTVTVEVPASVVSPVEVKTVTVFCGTWNVNGQPPPPTLDPWLVRRGLRPDVYCIGFQELDLSASALVLGDNSKAAPWEAAIQSTLATVGDYAKLITRQLVGVLLCVYVQHSLMPKISEVQSDIMPVGILGVMGNKGGVGVRFNLYDSTFCVVNSHLNAHVDNVARRNQDYHDIARELVFFRDNRRSTIWDHDFLFWIGDLNYRLLGNDADIRAKIRRRDFASLSAQDQLKQQQRDRLAFDPFTEAPISFAPTYKYDKDSTEYDTSAQARTPAWCDRILWRVTEQDSLANVDYTRHEMLTSDHRPVSAIFLIKAKSGLLAARSRKHQVQLRQMDSLENEAIPDVAFSSNELDFGNVRYMVPQSRKLIIKNVGQVPVRWKFAPKPDERFPFKPWLQASPQAGLLQPGEQAAVLLVATVDRTTANAFCAVPNADKLDEILIVRLDGGKDYFISINGRYLKSSFGATIELLCRYLRPLRTSDPAPTRKLRVPKEIWRLVDHLYAYGMDEPDLFVQPGGPDIDAIRSCLDTGESFALFDFNIHSVAATLLQLLDNLGQPIIPVELCKKLLRSSHAECKQLLASLLDDESYTTFYYVLAFLRELLTHSSKNKLTPERLAVIFSEVLLRVPPAPAAAVAATTSAGSTTTDAASTKEDADFLIYRFLVEASSAQRR